MHAEGPKSSGEKQLRVLLADDSPSLRQMLKLLCARIPGLAMVGEAADGTQALNLVRELKPDLLILDLKMPGATGLDVLKALQHEPAPPIIILWTGLPAEMYGEKLKGLGVRYHFQKGQQVMELHQTLQALVADVGD